MFKAGKKYYNHVLTCLKEAWKAEKARFTKAMNMYYLWNLATKQEKERDAKRNVKKTNQKQTSTQKCVNTQKQSVKLLAQNGENHRPSE